MTPVSEPVNTSIPVNGALNTTDPVSAVPTGTLIDATDCGHRWIGPRQGMSRSATAQGVSGVARTIYEFDGVDDYILHPYNAGQMTLGVDWTLDVLFEVTAVGADSGTLFLLGSSTHQDIWLRLDGSGAVTPRIVKGTIRDSTTGGAAGTVANLETTVIVGLSVAGTPASDPTKIHHVRLVRAGPNGSASVALYLDVLDGTSPSLSGALSSGFISSVGHAYVGDGIYLGSKYNDAGDFFGGWIYKTMLREGVYTDLQDGWMDLQPTRANNVLFYSTGGPTTPWVGTASGDDISRFRNYGTVNGSPATDTLSAWPVSLPIQNASHYTDRQGRVWNVVYVAGRPYYERAT